MTNVVKTGKLFQDPDQGESWAVSPELLKKEEVLMSRRSFLESTPQKNRAMVRDVCDKTEKRCSLRSGNLRGAAILAASASEVC